MESVLFQNYLKRPLYSTMELLDSRAQEGCDPGCIAITGLMSTVGVLLKGS